MSPWHTRKNGRGGQRGLKFKTGNRETLAERKRKTLREKKLDKLESQTNSEVCPFCFKPKITFDPQIDGKGRYSCGNCGAEFAVAQQIDPSEPKFWDEVAETCDFDPERVEQKADELATKLPKTSGITYGTGAMWYAYNAWKRSASQ